MLGFPSILLPDSVEFLNHFSLDLLLPSCTIFPANACSSSTILQMCLLEVYRNMIFDVFDFHALMMCVSLNQVLLSAMSSAFVRGRAGMIPDRLNYVPALRSIVAVYS